MSGGHDDAAVGGHKESDVAARRGVEGTMDDITTATTSLPPPPPSPPPSSSPFHPDDYDDDDVNNDGNGDQHSATIKRLAKIGQWRTPPLPAFATLTSAATTTTTSANDDATSALPLPASADEYARMLRDAYERGAEAGARVASASASSGNNGAPSFRPKTTTTTAIATADATAHAAAVIGIQHHPNDAHPRPTMTSTSMGEAVATTAIAAASSSVVVGEGMARPPPPRQDDGTNNSRIIGGGGGDAILVGGNNNNKYSSFLPPSAVPSYSSTSMTPPFAQQKSTSMPDMSSYNHHHRGGGSTNNDPLSSLSHRHNNVTNDEEDKRKKRLARNRASARLRRLKKKNLVDSYEGEVGILEMSLSKLRSHKWGGNDMSANDHEVLIEALSMERGQQPLTPDGRRELIRSILNQQREQVANLLECQMENWLLCSLARPDDAGGGEGGVHQNDEMAQIANELKSLLDLNPNQISLIEQCSGGISDEVGDLFKVDDCLNSIQSNSWLLDEGVDEVANQFTSVLNQTQLSKFLLWCDHNAESIERLDYVNALGGGGGVVDGGPPFEFGVDEGLADGD
jgi:hypothetical protein